MKCVVLTVVVTEHDHGTADMYDMMDPLDPATIRLLTEGYNRANDTPFDGRWIHSTAVINMDEFVSCYDVCNGYCRLFTSDRESYTVKKSSLEIASIISGRVI